MYLRLAFSIAVHSTADILLFDEVLTVGDQEFRDRCAQKIAELIALEKTIIIVSHEAKMLGMCPYKIITLEHGAITTG